MVGVREQFCCLLLCPFVCVYFWQIVSTSSHNAQARHCPHATPFFKIVFIQCFPSAAHQHKHRQSLACFCAFLSESFIVTFRRKDFCDSLELCSGHPAYNQKSHKYIKFCNSSESRTQGIKLNELNAANLILLLNIEAHLFKMFQIFCGLLL